VDTWWQRVCWEIDGRGRRGDGSVHVNTEINEEDGRNGPANQSPGETRLSKKSRKSVLSFIGHHFPPLKP